MSARSEFNRRIRRALGAVRRASGKVAEARAHLVEDERSFIEVDGADGALKETLAELAIADRALDDLGGLLQMLVGREGWR